MKENKKPQQEISIVWMTWALVAISVLTYIGMLQQQHLPGPFDQNLMVASGALVPSRLWSGELWRLLTASFVHGSFFHLIFNVMVLIQIGKFLESRVGASRFLFIYVVSAISGFALSTLLHPGLAFGSSSALFGLIGAVFSLSLLSPQGSVERLLSRTLALAVGAIILLSLVVNPYLPAGASIDVGTQIGGLVAGFFAGFVVVTDGVKPVLRGLSVASLGFVALTVVLSIRPLFLPFYHITMGNIAVDNKRTEVANAHANFLARRADTRGYAYLLRGRLNGSEALYRKALSALDPNPVVGFNKAMDGFDVFSDEKMHASLCRIVLVNDLAHMPASILNGCAWLLLMAKDPQVRDPEKALTWASAAVKNAKSDLPMILHTLAEAYFQNRAFDEAQVALDRAMTQSDKRFGEFLAQEKKRYLASKTEHKQ